jgi:hypothetical protein
MKNFSLIFVYVLLSLTLVLACGQKEEPAKTQKATDQPVPQMQIDMIS